MRDLAPGGFGRIVQLDIPGSGAKRGRPDTLTRLEVVAELQSEIEAAGLDRPTLIGHSVAGTLLTELVRVYRFRAVCFLTTAILGEGQIAGEMFGATAHGVDPDHVGFPADPSLVSGREMDRLRFCQDEDPEFAEAWLDDCHNDIIPRKMMSTPGRGVHVSALPPTTYVVATGSPVFPVEWQLRFAANLGPNVNVVDLPTGHAPFFTHPRLLAELFCRLYASPAAR
jgi:pimeloyl-ACP methyl ester carboxylesterase